MYNSEKTKIVKLQNLQGYFESTDTIMLNESSNAGAKPDDKDEVALGL